MIRENSLFLMNNVISNKHGSLLDLVLTAEPYLVDEPVEWPLEFATDHSILYTFRFNLVWCNKQQIPRVVYNCKQDDFSTQRSVIKIVIILLFVISPSEITVRNCHPKIAILVPK